MISKRIINSYLKQQKICNVRYRSTQINLEKLEKESTLSTSDYISEEAKLREEKIEQSRNKSRLREQDRNILLNKNPYPEPKFFHHGSLKYLRRTYGRYGEASGINPSLCWPIKEELDDAKEYEKLKYPSTIPDMIMQAKKLRKAKEENVAARQREIVKKMEKLEYWKQDLFDRIAKKEAEAKSAKERKERLVEEVKRHFGYAVDPKDDKFKEMLEKKEKEQKKAMKAEKRKQKEAKMMNQVLKTYETDKSVSVDDKETTNVEKIVPEKE
ncbi:growth arrest and DNA damage-inducible proteins-interacting protein 1 [Diorhabda sublineata]|uniref:growth arrest and DNA damage-inducible proteins-interacting protein 1 n=1 Tax=Diorhabda sublineata TaxID=1163346 RepID=UPI0024E11538|nr:growth arrest and DNA damage-inducible proteins-interacting protein 1 [Diorhabda sublineata]